MLGREITLQSIYRIVRRNIAKYGCDGNALSRAIVQPQRFDPEGEHQGHIPVGGFTDASATQ